MRQHGPEALTRFTEKVSPNEFEGISLEAFKEGQPKEIETDIFSLDQSPPEPRGVPSEYRYRGEDEEDSDDGYDSEPARALAPLDLSGRSLFRVKRKPIHKRKPKRPAGVRQRR